MRCSPCPSRGQQRANLSGSNAGESDAARAPHGDSNVLALLVGPALIDAARAPHGDSNPGQALTLGFDVLDAARTPHGDSNAVRLGDDFNGNTMQPAPLTGTTTSPCVAVPLPAVRCSPHPSRGQQQIGYGLILYALRCSPHPSRRQQPNSCISDSK